MNHNPPVLTITLNPALDMTAQLAELEPGVVNLISDCHLHPAGKGINVARVLNDLGHPVTVTGLLGEDNQDRFVELFAQRGIQDAFVRVPGSNRQNIKLVEQSRRVTDLNFPGICASEETIARFADQLTSLAQSHELIVVAGSLPPGLPVDTFRQWLQTLHDQQKKVVLDSSGAALSAGLAARPWLVKPNQEELSQWAGTPLHTEAELMAAGDRLAASGIKHVVISRGEQGVLWYHHRCWYRATPPPVPVVSTVGAGDTLLAGMCHGITLGQEQTSALALATALSALAVSRTDVGIGDWQKIDQMVAQIPVELLRASL